MPEQQPVQGDDTDIESFERDEKQMEEEAARVSSLYQPHNNTKHDLLTFYFIITSSLWKKIW